MQRDGLPVCPSEQRWSNRDHSFTKSFISMTSFRKIRCKRLNMSIARYQRNNELSYTESESRPEETIKKPPGTIRSGRLSRILDFYIGFLILWTIGRVRRRATLAFEPHRIGLCAFGAVGDALLSSAIIRDLKSRYPTSRITMVTTKTNASITPLLTACDESLVLPIFYPWRAISQMRQQKFDLLIDANQWLRISAVYCALAKARCTLGFRTTGQFRHYAYDLLADHSARQHELANYRSLLSAIGISGVSCPELDTTKFNQDVCIEGRYAVFHPWAGGRFAALKEWDNNRWTAVARIMAKHELTIVITGSSRDFEKTTSLADDVRRAGVSVISMAGSLNLGETAVILQKAALVVSVNTGIMHMAAALGTPLVALHGPTNPDRWGPVGDRSVNVVPDAPKNTPTGYLNLGFEFPRNVSNCMQFISVDSVVEAIETILIFT
jgi:ADP-heptose:LPS heptosyltransferase